MKEIDEALKVGDIVYLKSGGPAMTLAGRLSATIPCPDGFVICQWFEGSKCREWPFPLESLTRDFPEGQGYATNKNPRGT